MRVPLDSRGLRIVTSSVLNSGEFSYAKFTTPDLSCQAQLGHGHPRRAPPFLRINDHALVSTWQPELVFVMSGNSHEFRFIRTVERLSRLPTILARRNDPQVSFRISHHPLPRYLLGIQDYSSRLLVDHYTLLISSVTRQFAPSAQSTTQTDCRTY
jgi:hypothetical protein